MTGRVPQLNNHPGRHPRTLRLLAVLLATGLVLAAPTLARAQGPNVAAAPVAFKNQTNLTLEIQSESIIDAKGQTVPFSRVWTLKPGEYSWLDAGNMQKLHAKKFSFMVKTPGKTSRWNSVSTGPDGNGYFSITFTQDLLKTHLGEAVVANSPPPVPLTEQKAKQLVDRNTKLLFDRAHRGARDMTMLHQSTTPMGDGGFTMQYLMTWTSSLTGNKNTTDWTFEFSNLGAFKTFRWKTSWPTGGFEIDQIALTLVRDYLLTLDSVKNNPALRQAIQNTPNVSQLTVIQMQLDQLLNP